MLYSLFLVPFKSNLSSWIFLSTFCVHQNSNGIFCFYLFNDILICNYLYWQNLWLPFSKISPTVLSNSSIFFKIYNKYLKNPIPQKTDRNKLKKIGFRNKMIAKLKHKYGEYILLMEYVEFEFVYRRFFKRILGSNIVRHLDTQSNSSRNINRI